MKPKKLMRQKKKQRLNSLKDIVFDKIKEILKKDFVLEKPKDKT